MDRDIEPYEASLIQSFDDIHDLFECVENTFLVCMETLKAARDSTVRVTNGVEKLVTSFDEYAVCAGAIKFSRHVCLQVSLSPPKAVWHNSTETISCQLKQGLDQVKYQLSKSREDLEMSQERDSASSGVFAMLKSDKLVLLN
jgi:hypothetical protein